MVEQTSANRSADSSSESQCEVWIVRHGERIDETEQGHQWYVSCPTFIYKICHIYISTHSIRYPYLNIFNLSFS